MTNYELSKETPAFQLGYWAGYLKEEFTPAFLVNSNWVDYRRGYRAGIDDSYRDAGKRK